MFNNDKVYSLYGKIIQNLKQVDANKYEKTLVYIIDVAKPFEPVFVKRKIYPLYLNIVKNRVDNPYLDKLIVVKYNSSDNSVVSSLIWENGYNQLLKTKMYLYNILNSNEKQFSKEQPVMEMHHLDANIIGKITDKKKLDVLADNLIKSFKINENTLW
jgi:hypothetical protein